MVIMVMVIMIIMVILVGDQGAGDWGALQGCSTRTGSENLLDWTGILSNVFLLASLESLIFFSQVSESSWNFQTKSFLTFSSLACYPCSAEVAESAVPNPPNINNVNQVKDLVTSCTNPYSASEGAHHRDVTFSVGDCFCSSCVQFVKKLSRFPCSRRVYWVGRVQNAWLGKGVSRLSSFECSSQKAPYYMAYISFKLLISAFHGPLAE